MSYKITIPQPCSENWNTMNPTQKGAFCKSCEKEVIDFTHTSPYALSKKLEQGENICGRFKPEQLDTPLPSISQNQWKRNTIALGFTSLLAVAAPLAAQENPIEPIHTVETPLTVMGGLVKEPIPNDNITITGNVTDTNSLPLPGVNIVLKGTTINVQSDLNGAFYITFPSSQLTQKGVLMLHYIGYETQEMKIYPETKHIKATLREDLTLLGDIEIINYKEPNLFKRIGNSFQKSN